MAVQRRARVRLPGARARVRRARADAGGGRGRADQAALRADVLLPPRQGPLPGRAGGHAQARARRGGEEEAHAGAGGGLGGGAGAAATARRRSPRCKDELLYAPDRNKPETKRAGAGLREERAHAGEAVRALRAAARQPRLSPEALPARVLPAAARRSRRTRCRTWPASCRARRSSAFSLDDVGTTEIDDAFSVQRLADGVRIGIHISAPALGFAPGSASTRSRASACPPPTCRGASSPCCRRT